MICRAQFYTLGFITAGQSERARYKHLQLSKAKERHKTKVASENSKVAEVVGVA